MWRHPAVLVLLLPLTSAGFAQDTTDYAADEPPRRRDTRDFSERLWFGGGVIITFGTVTNLGVAPLVGYKIDPAGKLSSGIGLNYNYFSDNRYVPKYESSTYGWSLFSRYRIIEQLFLHAEYNAQNYEIYSPFSDQMRREWVPFMLVGGGFAQPMGGNSYFTVQILWDVIQDVRSPYGGQPWITAGVGVGF